MKVAYDLIVGIATITASVGAVLFLLHFFEEKLIKFLYWSEKLSRKENMIIGGLLFFVGILLVVIIKKFLILN